MRRTLKYVIINNKFNIDIIHDNWYNNFQLSYLANEVITKCPRINNQNRSILLRCFDNIHFNYSNINIRYDKICCEFTIKRQMKSIWFLTLYIMLSDISESRCITYNNADLN